MFFIASFTFFGAIYVLLPTLPLILSGQGATPLAVGWIMGAFAVAAVVSRIPTGRLLRRYSSIRLLLAGQAALGGGFVLYLLDTPLAMLLGRVLQGGGLGIYMVAAYLYLDQRAGAGRRAQFISLFGLSANVAMALGPMLGALVWQNFGVVGLYLFGMALCTVGFFLTPKPPKTPPARVHGRFWEAGAWPASTALLGFAAAYGAVMFFVPLAMAQAHIANGWLFFSTYAGVIMTARLVTIRLLDRGRRPIWAAAGAVLMLAAMCVLATAAMPATFLLAAALFGSGVAMAHPSFMAIAIESVRPEGIGGATAMSTAAFDAGIALGAGIAGLVANQWNLSTAFLAAAGCFALLSVPLFVSERRRFATPRSTFPGA